MNDPSSYGYDQGAPIPGQAPAQPGATPYPSNYKFSPDELRVLSECNRESFYQRSMPLSTAMGVTALIAQQKGYLKPNPRFGVVPKVTLAVVMGYFIGKLSYQETCAEKLMALPGSYIGQLLRERKEGKVRGRSVQHQVPSMFGANQSDIYSDAGPGSSLDLDTDRPLFNNDDYRPSNDGSFQGAPADDKPVRSALTYDELRRRNRGEYTDNKQDPYRLDPSQEPPPPPRRPPSPTIGEPNKPINKYGDTME